MSELPLLEPKPPWVLLAALGGTPHSGQTARIARRDATIQVLEC